MLTLFQVQISGSSGCLTTVCRFKWYLRTKDALYPKRSQACHLRVVKRRRRATVTCARSWRPAGGEAGQMVTCRVDSEKGLASMPWFNRSHRSGPKGNTFRHLRKLVDEDWYPCPLQGIIQIIAITGLDHLSVRRSTACNWAIRASEGVVWGDGVTPEVAVGSPALLRELMAQKAFNVIA
ncbi:hypothetical protein FIBSPDRAFT_1027205 [Athelia psychrophila]|uniref:Uncharacterized protein n=1 Tax=Athelia psychrophila TaxID=1759441 RepID=A0A166HDD4_9AGAM|nr:hypothetical protein FIBSPDRAFT_1027205 [Fibularhizoctonia sp. CBS 109695]